MEPTIDAAAAALATAAAPPITASGEETLTLVRDLARIAQHLGELTAAARGRLAAWGTVTPHLLRAETLAVDVTRCLSHAAGTYAFNTTQSGTVHRPVNPERIARLADYRRTNSAHSATLLEASHL